MLYQGYEVQGTDLPIFRQRVEDLLTYEEMILLGERLDRFKIAGYIQVIKFGQVFFEPVYEVRH